MNSLRFLSLTLLSVLFFCGIASGLTVNRTLAEVNGEFVTLADYGRFMKKSDPSADREKVSESYLTLLIEEKIIFQEALRRGLAATDEEVLQAYAAVMEQSGQEEKAFEARILTEYENIAEFHAMLRESLTITKLIEKDVYARIVVRDTDLRRYYEEHRNRFLESPEKVQLLAVMMKLSPAPSLAEITDLKIRALRIAAEARKGTPFESLVYQHAEEPLKSRNGLLGEFSSGSLLPQLDEQAVSMKEGDVRGPVWVRESVYILKAAKRSGAVYAVFENLRQEIEAAVREEMQAAALNVWIKKLWDRSSIRLIGE